MLLCILTRLDHWTNHYLHSVCELNMRFEDMLYSEEHNRWTNEPRQFNLLQPRTAIMTETSLWQSL